MANIITNNQYYTDIANAIRGKNGEETLYKPSEMALAIDEIETGVSSSSIIVTAPTGSTVTCSMGNITKTAVEDNGTWTFKNCGIGTWTVTAAKDGKSDDKEVVIEVESQRFTYYVSVSFNSIPEFTYTGAYEIVDDNNEEITFSDDDFKVRLLESGTLTIQSLNGAEDGVDIFAVGGAGGCTRLVSGQHNAAQGGSGYSATESNVTLQEGVSYVVEIGAGGNSGSSSAGSGGASSMGMADSDPVITASGGKGANRQTPGTGGEETGEFGDDASLLRYCGYVTESGVGPSPNTGYAPRANTTYNGASGIIIIRNARGAG